MAGKEEGCFFLLFWGGNNRRPGSWYFLALFKLRRWPEDECTAEALLRSRLFASAAFKTSQDDLPALKAQLDEVEHGHLHDKYYSCQNKHCRKQIEDLIMEYAEHETVSSCKEYNISKRRNKLVYEA